MFRIMLKWCRGRKASSAVPRDAPMTEQRAIAELNQLRGDRVPCGNSPEHIMLRFLLDNGHRRLGRVWCAAVERNSHAQWRPAS